jgi:hypothetical protein
MNAFSARTQRAMTGDVDTVARVLKLFYFIFLKSFNLFENQVLLRYLLKLSFPKFFYGCILTGVTD